MLTLEPISVNLNGYDIQSSNVLTLSPSTTYLVFGDSSSGASELLQLIGGLADLVPSSTPADQGKVLRTDISIPSEQLRPVKFRDGTLYDMPRRDRAKHIGIVFENPEWSLLGGTVLEEFWFSFSASGSPRPPMAALRRYGLLDQRHQQTETLSGGEMQRLNCAAVLEGERDLIIADFSSSNLDRDFLQDFLLWTESRATHGAIIVIYGLAATQVPSSTSPIYIDSGHLLFANPPEEQFPSPDVEARILREHLTRPSPHSDARLALVAENVWGEHTRAGFSCTLRRNEVLIVEGPNGCGKTTIGRMLVENGHPYSGTFNLFDSSPAIAFQHPEHCFFADSVWDELPDRSLLTLMRIPESSWPMHPRNLSKSRQKLLSIGATLVLSKGFAILDEPTCGMDHSGKMLFIELLNKFPDLAVLIFTHDAALNTIGTLVDFLASELNP